MTVATFCPTYLCPTYLCLTYPCLTYLCLAYLCLIYPCLTTSVSPISVGAPSGATLASRLPAPSGFRQTTLPPPS